MIEAALGFHGLAQTGTGPMQSYLDGVDAYAQYSGDLPSSLIHMAELSPMDGLFLEFSEATRL